MGGIPSLLPFLCRRFQGMNMFSVLKVMKNDKTVKPFGTNGNTFDKKLDLYGMFADIHAFLKEYNCKPTYDWEQEFKIIEQGNVWKTESFFYETFEEAMSNEYMKPEWKEVIDANLDVVLHTEMKQAQRAKQIRFDIDYSKKVQLYSMYISLPGECRSIPVSKNLYRTQEEVLKEVRKWVDAAKCVKKGKKVYKLKVI
jgi:hypothetical protein